MFHLYANTSDWAEETEIFFLGLSMEVVVVRLMDESRRMQAIDELPRQ